MSRELKTDPRAGTDLSSLPAKTAELTLRAHIFSAVRDFFTHRGYLEVETPYRVPAPAPEPYIDAVPTGDMFLHTSPELCMKRLLAAGYSKIFQICKCFRAGERGSLHIPEFTMLEWYRSGCNYLGLMKETESLICSVADVVNPGRCIVSSGQTIDLSPPWPRFSVKQAFAKHSTVPLESAIRENLFDEIMVRDIEPKLGLEQPTFIYDYPASMAALARTSPSDPSLAERFELYIGGIELANGFSELTDPVEQEARFLAAETMRRGAGKPPYPKPVKFLEALYHMPEAAGIALGMDRLVMAFCDTTEIDDVVAFTPEDL
ncbi:MAG TPA: EF-P lysine aminoacylase GenX [Desulfobacteraceae bacterium]|nr:EF-P lysine aminoacylase GenX [Desulfobacteraceae bacterium]